MSGARYPALAGRHVVVTGGADGIGAALVEAFCAQQALVTFLDIDDARAAATVERAAAGGTVPHFVHCDVADVPALRSALAEAEARDGAVRVLVNNAANDARHDWREVTPESWDAGLAVNLRHQFFAIQAVADGMAMAGGGSIINFSSISWKLGMGGMPAYTTSKSGVIGLTRSFARDLGPANIRVNAVLPGWIMTRRQRELYLTPEGEEKLLADQCLKRVLMPADVAPLVLFLADDASAACTAQSYVIDGGWI
ncbi:SDR family NAD(P)-dependent oxidoreductase [Sphingomonas sp.]|uniref:SDR family NAD(P)-dependent oxidoreductase n=1 Tax=Sphingomonas sp. TaxID=28214 RepID=UPI002DD6A94D|nr:SDR family oxidoreductase [Sphingomonas sp.]